MEKALVGASSALSACSGDSTSEACGDASRELVGSEASDEVPASVCPVLVAGKIIQVCPNKTYVDPITGTVLLGQLAFWSTCFENPVAKLLVRNYLSCSGTKVHLTKKGMADIHPTFDISTSPEFASAMNTARTSLAKGGVQFETAIAGKALAYATAGATLGNFWVAYQGGFKVCRDGRYLFTGTGTFSDYWDFDPKPSGNGRSEIGEGLTRLGDKFLSGTPFNIDSDSIAIHQTEASKFKMTDSRAVVEVQPSTNLQGLSGACRQAKGRIREPLVTSPVPRCPTLDCGR